MALVQGGLAEIEGNGPGVGHEGGSTLKIGDALGFMRDLDEERAEEVERAAILRILGDSDA